MRPSDGWLKTRRRLGGIAFLVVFALGIWLSLAVYHKKFTPVAMVTLLTASTGNEMHNGAQVMVRGVQVGEVRQVSADGAGARLELAIQPGMVHLLPANVTAQMMPTTLFGERYVDLVLPARPAQARLVDGSVIRQDDSADAIEVEQVLNNLLPLLTAMQPEQLSFTLTAIAQGLRGQGAAFGHALVQLNGYLHSLRPHLPALDSDIAELAKVAKTYTGAAPDILHALNDFAIVSRTVYRQRGNLIGLFGSVTTASDDLRSFLDGNYANIIALSADSTSTLDLLARYSPEFPCTLNALTESEPNIDKVLGAGTGQPGLHVQVHVVKSLGKYVPKANAPVYGDNLGPRCYSVPFRGITLHDGTGLAPRHSGHGTGSASNPPAAGRRGAGKGQQAQTTSSADGAFAGLGPANSPQQDELIDELAALSLHTTRKAVPDWSGLLVGPLFRGAEVTLR
ncbi:MAG TPA: MCE family protein [Streptosporangiaceae bacterium]|jgi:phospholipid/cholesterol/gamma-HCH transport system substrate-binding protein